MNDSTSLPPLRERAAGTLAHIEQHFALGNGDYREKSGGRDASFAWGHGVLVSAFVAASAFDSERYLPLLAAQAGALRRGYWRPDGPVAGYNASRSLTGAPARYYDDNAWFAIAYGDAAARRLTGAPYKRFAQDALDFALSGRDPKTGGLFWQEQHKTSQNTCSAAPTAVGATIVTGSDADAFPLYEWLHKTLRDPADGLYWDNISVPNGVIDRAKWSYNSALVLRLELQLARRKNGEMYRDRAIQLADACLAHWYDGDQKILKDDSMFAHLLNEALLETYTVTKLPRFRDAALHSLDTLWSRVRRADGSYPKRWDAHATDKDPTELLWIASAARAYAFAVPYETAKHA